MMKTGKRTTLALFLALCLVLAMAVGADAAIIASGDCGENLTWELNDAGTLTITGSGKMEDSPWSSYSGEIKKVTIGTGVTSIGDYAFYDCSSLTEVTIPNSVTSIGNTGFRYCASLTTIEVAYGNREYISNQGVLFNQDGTTLIQYPCGKSGAYTIPNRVTSIGDYAFFFCTGLTKVTISKRVTSIGNSAFEGCTKLTEVTIPDSVTSIGNTAFGVCTNLTKVTIPNSVTSIGSTAFCDCTGLTNITIPRGVTSIGDYAFWNCTGLTKVTIPDSVTSIGNFVFLNCTRLTRIDVAESNPNYSSDQQGMLFNKDKTTLIHYPCGKSGAYTIPDSVTSVGSGAFRECTGLTEVTIPDSVTSIGDYAFEACTDLTEVTIPDSVIFIGNAAFRGCTGLTEVTIPASVISIGNAPLDGCTSLTRIEVAESNPNYSSDQQGVFFNKDKTTLIHHPCGKSGAYTIPDSVTSIGDYAFEACTGLTEVTIPDSVTSIGWDAFYGCTGLIAVTIPDSVTSIRTTAFAGCDDLTIYCHSGSYAETYAKENGIPFIATVAVTGVTLNKTALSLEVGKSETLTATVAPNNADNKKIAWKSSDAAVATVDNNGKVTAVKAGKATITVTTADGGKTATCEVTVTAGTTPTPDPDPNPDPNPDPDPNAFRFDDVKDSKAFYFEAVYWAVDHKPQITNGMTPTLFKPNDTCTRAQVVTFLWRAKGQPEPKSANNPFSDVKSGDYFYKAVLWAVENGITEGMTKTTFGPKQGCTRGQVVTFLHRAENKPAAAGKNVFVDVKAGAYYYDAVLWAVGKEITNGTDATHFSPEKTCTRGQIVTFLYRDLAK